MRGASRTVDHIYSVSVKDGAGHRTLVSVVSSETKVTFMVTNVGSFVFIFFAVSMSNSTPYNLNAHLKKVRNLRMRHLEAQRKESAVWNKISRGGYESLTQNDRAILRNTGSKFRRNLMSEYNNLKKRLHLPSRSETNSLNNLNKLLNISPRRNSPPRPRRNSPNNYNSILHTNPTKATLTHYTKLWLKQNIPRGASYRVIAMIVHPNKGNGTNLNNQAKRVALFKLLGRLKPYL